MKILFTLCTILFTLNASAQMSVGLGGGLLSSTEEGAEANFGGEFYGKFELTNAFRIGANIGFYQKSYDILGTKLRTNFLPISALAEYVFMEDKIRPYAGLHIGVTSVGASISGGESSSEAYFSTAPVAGLDLGLTDELSLNINVKYGFVFYDNELTEGNDNFQYFSPNIGVSYKL